jgi:hypothetical protein
MWFSSWLTNRNPSRAGTRGSVPRKRSTFRPRLEALEDRWVPAILTVTTTADSGPGSLRDDVAAAHAGDTIDFAPGLAGQTILLTSGELVLNTSLTIQGPSAPQAPVTISGGGFSRVFEIDGTSTAVNLSGLSIVDGIGLAYAYTPGGGCLFGGGGTPSDGQGGAIWNGGVLNVTGCTLMDNSADTNPDPCNPPPTFYGGAIYNAGTLTISNSALSHNAAGDTYTYHSGGNGGAIYNAGTLSVNSNSTLSFNTANGFTVYGTGFGGAIDNAGSLSVSVSTLSDNGAFDGGAISNGAQSTATLTGVTLSGNTASVNPSTNGGAIWNAGTMTLSGCSVSGNTAGFGGGIYNTKGGRLTIQAKSTVTGNTAGFAADLYNLGFTKISKDSTIGVVGG